jgi:hypothetical protein
MLVSSLGRVLNFDLTLGDAECDQVIAAIDADSAPAGLDAGEQAIRAIIRSHPVADVHDPDGYIAACAAIMSEYPLGVLARVRDPRTGIVRRIKFLPKPAEIAEACDAEMERRKNMRLRADGIKCVHAHEAKKLAGGVKTLTANPDMAARAVPQTFTTHPPHKRPQ